MMPPGTFSASFARVSPTRRLSSSLSSTQGPAMRNSLSAGKNSATLFPRFEGRALPDAAGGCLRLHGRADEAGEQRVRARRTRLELWIKLAAEVPRVRRQLHHLHEGAIG